MTSNWIALFLATKARERRQDRPKMSVTLSLAGYNLFSYCAE